MSTRQEEEVEKRIAPQSEIGTTGLHKAGGIVFEEFLPGLQGERGYQIYREMRDNEPVIGGLLFALEMMLRQADWRVDPGETDNPDAEKQAEFIEQALEDMSHSFNHFLAEVASMFPFGWSFFEIVYKRRGGPKRQPGKSSRFDDGLIGWRKFAFRGQDTLWRWEFDEQDGIQAMSQLDVNSGSNRGVVEIPIEKALLFRTTSHKNNPEGRSILRNAYRPWYFKKRIEEIEAIGVERDLAGMPIVYAPEELFDKDASPSQKALFNTLKEAVRKVRRDEQDGMVFPLSYDEDNGKERYRFELASTGGSRQIDTDKVIRRKNMEMALVVLADFILLGHEQVGSFALSQDKTNLFAVALDGYLTEIAETFNRHAIPRLLRLNGMDTTHAPTLHFESVRAPSLEDIAGFVQKLAQAGAPFFPDAELQGWLHEQAGMPPPSEDSGGPGQMTLDGLLGGMGREPQPSLNGGSPATPEPQPEEAGFDEG